MDFVKHGRAVGWNHGTMFLTRGFWHHGIIGKIGTNGIISAVFNMVLIEPVVP